MKIYMFIALMGVGGAERVCVSLANAFVQKGHEVHIAVLNLSNDANTHLLDKRCHVHELGVSRLRYAALPMLKFIRRHKPDTMLVFGNEMGIILSHLRTFGLIRMKIALRVLNNVNISLSKEDHVSPVVEAYLKKQQKQMRKMEAVITQCEAMGEMLLARGLVEKEKLYCIYNPVSQKVVESVQKETGTKKSGRAYKKIVFIGRLDPQKQPAHLIKAFALVKQKHPDAVLELAGDGVLRKKLEKQVMESALSDCIHFMGMRKDIGCVYAGADVVALSSLYEGMPNCLIEAVCAGIPVVSYDCPIGPSEIVEDGINGFLVENGNITMLAEKLSKALTWPWDVQAIKKSAEKFDPMDVADRYLEVLRQCGR